ncbi:MAG: GNAT family N-acetyltransferase [Candidatus Ozemobacteraceae bacterium]
MPQTRSSQGPVIRVGECTLRLGRDEDVPAILRHFRANKNHLGPFSPVYPADFFTSAFHLKRVQKSRAEFEAGTSLRLYIFRDLVSRNAVGSREKKSPTSSKKIIHESALPEVIGTIGFGEFSRGAFQACYLGYGLSKSEQGKGIMLRCVQAALTYVFEKMHIHRIMANYLPRNTRSGNLLRRLGFVIEGVAREYLQINGVWEDHILTSLTNQRWKPAPLPLIKLPHP